MQICFGKTNIRAFYRIPFFCQLSHLTMTTKLGLFALAAVLFIAPFGASAAILNRQLDLTMTGSDVSALQTFLATDVTLYPQGLVTGYYGFLTKAAVSNFQSRNGIEPVGRVGPQTLPVLNLQMAGGGGIVSAGIAPIITTVGISSGRNNASISWNTSEPATGVVYYSTGPLSTYENKNAVTVSGSASAMTDSSFRTSQNVGLSNLQANTVYHYMVYTTDQDGNVSVTWPSTFQTSN